MEADESFHRRLKDPLLWVDLEMTGLDLKKDQIIEAAVILTDGFLNRVVKGPSLVIKAPKELLDSMDEWCQTHHGASGLRDACIQSTITMEEAEKEILGFILSHVEEPGALPLAGNSVHVDRQFLLEQMPSLMARLSYRIVDVSSIYELCRRWYPGVEKTVRAARSVHRAQDDILASIEELRGYKKLLFRDTVLLSDSGP